MKNVLKPIAKRVLILLGLTIARSVAYAGIHRKCIENVAPRMTALITFNEEINDIMKIDVSLDESVLLVKDVSEK